MNDCGCKDKESMQLGEVASTGDAAVIPIPGYPETGGVDMPAEANAFDRSAVIPMPGYPYSGGESMPAASESPGEERPNFNPMPE